MTLLDSLLDAIIRLDGDALVMHVGEKPYVVLGSATVNALRGPLAWGQVELSSRPLTGEAMTAMLGQMLSDDQRRALIDLGAIEEEIEVPGESGGQFIVTAARGGEDVWVEVRRRKAPAAETAPIEEVPVAVPDAAVTTGINTADSPDTATPAGYSASSEWIQETGVDNQVAALPVTAPAVTSPDVLPAVDVTERVAALEREAAATLAAREAVLAVEADAALAARLAELESEAAASLAEKQAALAALAAQAEAAAAQKEAALAAQAEAALAVKEAAIRAESDAAVATREAALREDLQRALVAREAAVRADLEAVLVEKESALKAQADAVQAARDAAARAEAKADAFAKQVEATFAERMEALAAEASAARAAAEAALTAEAERTLAATVAELSAQAERALVEREHALIETSRATFAAREGELAAAAERALSEKQAALAAEAERTVAERQAALSEAERALAERHAALAVESERLLAERQAALAETERLLAEKASAITAEAQRHAENETAQIEEVRRALALKEAALAAEAARLAEKESAIAAEIQSASAEREIAAAEARRLSEQAAAIGLEAERAIAEKEAALAAETQRALAEKEAALAAETQRALAEREASLAADTQRALAEKEAALTADIQRALAERHATLEAEAQRALDEKLSALVADAARERAASEAALEAEARRLADREAAVARMEAEYAARESALAAERDALQIAEAEAAATAEALAVLSAQADAEMAAADTRASVAEQPVGVADALPVAVVTPIARPPLKLQPPQSGVPAAAASTEASLVELLRAAAEHGASIVYAVVDTRPMMRISGAIALVGTQAPVAAGDVERFIFQFAPRELVADATPEWTCTIPEVGRVRCVAFHDHAGAGLIFHLPSREAAVADDVSIGEELRSLCDEADGLIVVSGPRSSGKSALLGAFVDVINHTRYDHVITIESQIRRVHEKRLSFISQREVRGDGDAIAKAAGAALREGPDVLVIEDLRAPEALVAALDAARAGRLVFGSISAATAPGAIERLIDAVPADRRPQVRASLAGALRAAVAQILVPKSAGGRIAAREILLSSPAVRRVILDGAISQLPIAIESGRNLGMRTMVDALGALVRDGVVDLAVACASAPDRAALVSALDRDGIDVSGLEKRA